MILHQSHNSRGNHNYNAKTYTNIRLDMHFHKNYELIYIKNGASYVSANGQRQLLSKGEIILLPPYCLHDFTADDKTKMWVCVFSDDFIPQFSSKNSHVAYSKFSCDKAIDTFLNEHLFFDEQPDLYMTNACLYLICSECVKKAHVYDVKQEDNFRERVISYVAQNLHGDITLSGAATALGYEYHYFSGLFNGCFDMHFKDFINIFRFEYACELLLKTREDITFLASECGFQSLRNFNRIFKKLSGLTPSEYRRCAGRADVLHGRQ